MRKENFHMYIPGECIYIHTKTKQNMVKLNRGLEIRVFNVTFLTSITVL